MNKHCIGLKYPDMVNKLSETVPEIEEQNQKLIWEKEH